VPHADEVFEVISFYSQSRTRFVRRQVQFQGGSNRGEKFSKTIRVTKAEALPVKKPKKPKVKSSSPIEKKPPRPREPIQNPAKSLPQTNTAGQQPQDQQMKNPPKHWSLMKRVVGLIAPKGRKGP
jgi:hypothetical protein